MREKEHGERQINKWIMRARLLFQPICCVRAANEQSTHTVFLYSASAALCHQSCCYAAAAGRKESQWARTQHARNQLHHKFIRSQILHKQTEVLFSFAKFMIHPGAHHNKQLAHAATGRDIKFHAGCAVIYAATHARELIWCTPDILCRHKN